MLSTAGQQVVREAAEGVPEGAAKGVAAAGVSAGAKLAGGVTVAFGGLAIIYEARQMWKKNSQTSELSKDIEEIARSVEKRLQQKN